MNKVLEPVVVWNSPPVKGLAYYFLGSYFFCPNNEPDNGVGAKTGGVYFFYLFTGKLNNPPDT